MPDMTPEEVTRRKTEVIDLIKDRLTNAEGDARDEQCGLMGSLFNTFCRLYNYQFVSDVDTCDNVCDGYIDDFDTAVFVLGDVNTAQVDGYIPAEWKP